MGVNRWPTSLVAIAAILLGAACSESDPAVLPEVPGEETEPAGEDPGSTSSSSTTSTTTRATTSTTTTSSTLAPDALVVVEQFPGVTFPAASLPTEAGSINNNRAPAQSEKDQALIAAFVAWVNASMEANASDPVAFDPLESLPMTEERRERLIAGYLAAAERGEVLDISGGLTVRPYVVERQEPNLGLVYDCSIDATVWRDGAGNPIEPRDGWPQVGPPGVEEGVGYLFELIDGEWVISSVFTEPGACG